MSRTACYIDGFNLYHAIHDLNRPHLKWVDLWALADSLTRDGDTLVAVNYFSAYATWRPGPYARHRAYVEALKLTQVTPFMAHFKKKQRACRRCGNSWTDHEEKETDVSIAVKLLEDGFDNVFDRAIVISADSDLTPAIKTVRRRFPDKEVFIAAPPGRFANARDLNPRLEVTRGRIAKHLLPAQISDLGSDTVITRPTEYDPPSP